MVLNWLKHGTWHTIYVAYAAVDFKVYNVHYNVFYRCLIEVEVFDRVVLYRSIPADKEVVNINSPL